MAKGKRFFLWRWLRPSSWAELLDLPNTEQEERAFDEEVWSKVSAPATPVLPPATPVVVKPTGSTSWLGGITSYFKPHPEHRGVPIRVGPYTIYAGGTRDLRPEDFDNVDLVIPLEARMVIGVGKRIEVLGCPWHDYGAPPKGFEELLKDQVIPLLAEGRKILVYCIGSHGRTGTFLAGLIALTETPEETPDPIAAVRVRHCKKCVETQAQAEAVFALRGEKLPKKYEKEFSKPPVSTVGFVGAAGHKGPVFPDEQDWDFSGSLSGKTGGGDIFGGSPSGVVTFRRDSVATVSTKAPEEQKW